MDELKEVHKKLVVVGDGSCGKTALLLSYSKDEFIEDYTPTIFETYAAYVQTGKYEVELLLWDTAGQEDYDRLRTISYNNTDVVLICYSVDCEDSFANIVEKWVPEVRHFCPGTPYLLVGCKKDLRPPGKKLDYITEEDGWQRARVIGAQRHMECSAKTREGVAEVFEEAAKCTLRKKKAKRRPCRIL